MAAIKLKRGQSTNLPSLNLQAGEPAFTLALIAKNSTLEMAQQRCSSILILGQMK